MTNCEQIYYFFEEDSFEECLKLCHKLLNDSFAKDKHYYAQFYKGKVEYEQGKFDESIDSFKQVLRLAPCEDQVWVSMACAYELKGDKKLALKAFIKEIRDFPKNEFGWQKLAGFLTRTHRYKLAKMIFDSVNKKGMIDYEISASEYAVSLYHAGTYEEELEYYKKLMKMNYEEDWIEDNYIELLKDISEHTKKINY